MTMESRINSRENGGKRLRLVSSKWPFRSALSLFTVVVQRGSNRGLTTSGRATFYYRSFRRRFTFLALSLLTGITASSDEKLPISRTTCQLGEKKSYNNTLDLVFGARSHYFDNPEFVDAFTLCNGSSKGKVKVLECCKNSNVPGIIEKFPSRIRRLSKIEISSLRQLLKTDRTDSLFAVLLKLNDEIRRSKFN